MVTKIYNSAGELFPNFKERFEYLTAGYTATGSAYTGSTLAQVFTIGSTGSNQSFRVLSIRFIGGRLGSPGTFWASICSAPGHVITMPRADLCSGSADGNTLTLIGGWKEVTLTPSVKLNSGEIYAIIMRAPLGDSSNYVFWSRDPTGSYGDPSSYSLNDYYNQASYNTNANYMFEVYGYLESSGIVNNITEQKVHRTVVHDLPGANFDVIQSLGTKNRRFKISGEVYTASGSAWLRALPGTTGSISHTDPRGYVYLPQTTVFFSNVDFEDRGGRPLERKFTLDIIEVI